MTRWMREAMDAARAIAARLRPEAADVVAAAAIARLEGLPDVSQQTLRPYGAAKWAVEASLRVAPLERGPSSGLEFPVADAPTYDGPADGAYRKGWADVRREIVADAVDALLARWEALKAQDKPPADTVIDLLEPVVDAVLDGKGIRDLDDRQMRALPVVEAIVDPIREAALSEYGTIPGPKVKPGMRKSRRIPTSGPASAVVTPGTDTADTVLGTIDQPPVRVGTEREEDSWDRLMRAMRPAREPGRKSGKQKGRLGGPAVIR